MVRAILGARPPKPPWRASLHLAFLFRFLVLFAVFARFFGRLFLGWRLCFGGSGLDWRGCLCGCRCGRHCGRGDHCGCRGRCHRHGRGCGRCGCLCHGCGSQKNARKKSDGFDHVKPPKCPITIPLYYRCLLAIFGDPFDHLSNIKRMGAKPPRFAVRKVVF